MIEIRTLEEFVEDLVTEGRTQKQVYFVAFNSRWKPFATEAFKIAKRLRRKLGKI